MDDRQLPLKTSKPVLTGWMIVIIVAIVALAGVGIAALMTHGSSSSSVASTTTKPARASTTTTVAPTMTVLPTTTIPQTTTTTASLANFVGSWSMHDGQLIVAANGGGTITIPGVTYGGCTQTAQIQLSPASPTAAVATITSIGAPGCPGEAAGFNPIGGGGTNENMSVGSTITLTFGPPGVETSIGINYCDQAHAAQQVCGA